MLGVCVLHAQSTAKVISGRNNTESCIITKEGSRVFADSNGTRCFLCV